MRAQQEISARDVISAALELLLVVPPPRPRPYSVSDSILTMSDDGMNIDDGELPSPA